MARYRRRSSSSAEDLFRLIFLLLAILAFGIGGLGNFAGALIFLLVTGIGALACVAAFVLTLRSHLVPTKKAGVIMLLGALVTYGAWNTFKAPSTWPQVNATIIQLTAPQVEASCEYQYQIGGVTFSYGKQTLWKSEEEARGRTPATLTLSINPLNPADASEKPMAGWKKIAAHLAKGSTKEVGRYEAKAIFRDGWEQKQTTFHGNFLRDKQANTVVPIFINPLNTNELSLEPRQTVGGKRNDLLFSSIALGLLGLGFLSWRFKEWRIQEEESILPQAVPVTSPRGMVPTLLRRIDWFQFEKVCARVLEAEGWTVSRRGGANPDGGADLLATKSGHTAVVQCKHWKTWDVSPKVLRELLGTKVSAGYTADSAILCTLSPCTEEARKFAAANSIAVYDAERLESRIESIGIEKFPELLNPDDKQCPKCGAPMILRQSAKGTFWGCTEFGRTRCRGVIETAD